MLKTKPLSATLESSGARALGHGLAWSEVGESGQVVVLAPSEQVLILIAELPLPGRRQRLAALPYAVEDRLAEPLEALHFALGAHVGPQLHLAGVVRHDLMRAWTHEIEAAGITRYVLIPDALTLPTPEPGMWSVHLAGGRVRVRTPEGGGFASPLALLRPAWMAASRPSMVSYGEPLPSDLSSIPAEGRYEPPAVPALDLRQGAYAAQDRPLKVALRRAAMVLAAGVVAHAAIAAADTAALHQTAKTKRAETLALMRQVAPNTPADADLVAELDRLLPSGGNAGSGFFPLVTRTFRALEPAAARLSFQDLSYAEAERALSLKVEASDLGGLQQVETALRGAGLAVSSGAATAESGRADAEIVVRAPGGAT